MANVVTGGKISVKSTRKSALWDLLDNYFKETCKGDEQCWIDTDVVKTSGVANVVAQDLRPRMPNEWLLNNKAWLTNFDINNVMVQYHKKYRTYKFLGVFPIDFAAPNGNGGCIINSMCNFDVAKMLLKGIKQVGVVFNLDRHDQAGSHWVALYANFDIKAPRGRYGVFYYDSNSMRPPEEVVSFQQSVIQQVSNIGVKRKFGAYYNTKRHQYGNTECGIFVMHFIERMLEGATFESIMKATEYDKEMNNMRHIYFRKSISMFT